MSAPQKKPHRQSKSIAGLLQNAKYSTLETGAGAQTTYACWLLPRCGGCFNRPKITEKNKMILLHTFLIFLHSFGFSFKSLHKQYGKQQRIVWLLSIVTCQISPELEKKKNCPNIHFFYFPAELFSNFSFLVCQARCTASFTCLPIPTNPGFGKSWLTQ